MRELQQYRHTATWRNTLLTLHIPVAQAKVQWNIFSKMPVLLGNNEAFTTT